MLLTLSTSSLTALAPSANPFFSSSLNGICTVPTIPERPSTAGMLTQHPNSGWKWLTGRTLRLSASIEPQMLEMMDPMPSGIAPLAWRMLREMRLLSSRSAVRPRASSSSFLEVMVEGQDQSERETPPMVAVDQATTGDAESREDDREYPDGSCTPRTNRSMELGAT